MSDLRAAWEDDDVGREDLEDDDLDDEDLEELDFDHEDLDLDDDPELDDDLDLEEGLDDEDTEEGDFEDEDLDDEDFEDDDLDEDGLGLDDLDETLDLDVDEGAELAGTVDVHCPYCGAEVEMIVDPLGGDLQEYVEDCEVCCQPWSVRVTLDRDGTASVELGTLDEG